MDPSHGHNHKHQAPSNSDLFGSAKVIAGAAQSTFSHGYDNVDRAKVADAAGNLLDAASHYGKLEEKGLGQYVDKAGEYLHQYGSKPGSHVDGGHGGQGRTGPHGDGGRSEGGYGGRSEGGYDGLSEGGYGGRSEGGYDGRSEGGYGGRSEGGKGGHSEGGYGGHSEGGHGSQGRTGSHDGRFGGGF